MTKAVKITVAVITSILVLAAVATISLTYFISPNYLKQQATSWFADNTDRTLEIKGKVSWHIFPSIGFTAKNIAIPNTLQFGQSNFIQAKSISANLSLFALLQKKIQITNLRLNNVNLNLQTNKKGVENWHVNVKTTKVNGAEKQQANNHEQHPSLSLIVNRVTLKNSRITWQNAQSGQKILLTKANLSSSSIAFNKPFTISGSAHVSSNDPKIDSNIQVNGKANYDAQQQVLSVKDFEFASSYKNDPMRTFSIHTTGMIDFNHGNFKLNAIEFEYAKAMAGRGKAFGKNLYENPTIEGHVSTNTFDLKRMLSNIGYPVQTSNHNSLNTVKLDGGFTADNKQIKLTNFKLRVDNTSIKTDAVYDINKHDVKVNVQGGHLDLNNFTGISLGNKASQPKTKSKKNNHTQHASTSKLNLQGNVSFMSIKYGKTELKDVKTDLNYRNKVLTLAPFSAQLFGGKTAGKIVLNMAGKSLRFAVAQKMNQINLGVMLGTLFTKRPLTGVAQLGFNIAAEGTSAQSIQNSLSGSAEISAANGVAHGVDIDYQFARVFGYLNKSKVTKGDTRKTEYQKVHAKMTIQSGLINNSLFEMSLEKFHLQGNGTVNLRNQQLDYKLGIKSLEPVRVKTPVSSTNLADYHIPLHIKGTISNPEPSLDLPEIAVITLQEAAKEVLIDQAVKGGPILKQVIDSPLGDAVKKPLGETLKKVLPF